MSEIKSRPEDSRAFLWIIAPFLLLFYAFFAFDFLTHPFAAGANADVGAPYLFRWLSFITGTFSVIIALFVIVRVRGNMVGPLLLIYAVGAVGWSGRVEWASLLQAGWFAAGFTLYFMALALPALIAMLFYFPTGRAYPQVLERWLPVLFSCMSIFGVFVSMSSAQWSGVPNPLYIPALAPVANVIGIIYPIALLVAIFTVVLRYRHGGFRERLQLKWVVLLGVFVISISLLRMSIPEQAARGEMVLQAARTIQVINFILWQGFAALAFGISILKHKLWDIDVIIRKTLVWTVLTGILGLVYFGGVTLFQSVFTVVSRQQSAVAIVLSTLAIAALFNPLRRRVQQLVDQRFYRRKYNSEQALASFAALAREEVDLEEISTRLLEVVEETLQPEHASLWLKPTADRRRPNAPRVPGESGVVEPTTEGAAK